MPSDPTFIAYFGTHNKIYVSSLIAITMIVINLAFLVMIVISMYININI